MSENLPALGPSANDAWAAYIKNTVGLVPWVGPFLGDFISSKIPSQRLDRLEQFARRLSEELGALTGGKVPELDREGSELLEEGFSEAVRPVTDERRIHIARIVAQGLTQDEVVKARHRKALSILRELDDFELAILRAHSVRRMGASWHLRGGNLPFGPEQRRAAQLGELADLKLERVGLVKFKPRLQVDRENRRRLPTYGVGGDLDGDYEITPIGQEIADLCPQDTSPEHTGGE